MYIPHLSKYPVTVRAKSFYIEESVLTIFFSFLICLALYDP